MSEISVSVILLTYNQEEFVGSAIESILNQDFDGYELLICDDGSTDNTVQVINDTIERAGPSIPVKKLFSETNQGIIDNVNMGLSAFQGKYFIIMGGDDISLVSRISTVFETFETQPDCALVLSSWSTIDKNGDVLGGRTLHNREYAYQEQSPSARPKSLYASSLVCGATAAYRREVWDVFGPILARGIRGEDNVLFVRALLLGKIRHSSQRLVLWRRHDDSVSYVGKQGASAGNPDVPVLKEAKCKILKNHEKIYLQWRKDIQQSIDSGFCDPTFGQRLKKLGFCKCHTFRLQRHSLACVGLRLWLRSLLVAVRSGCQLNVIIKSFKLRYFQKQRLKFIMKRV